jgi:hypothetical protein
VEDTVSADSGRSPDEERRGAQRAELSARLRAAARGDLAAFEGVYRELSGAVPRQGWPTLQYLMY